MVGGTWVEQTFVNAHDDTLAVFGSNSANYFSVGSGQASLAINGNGAQFGGPGSGTFEAFRLYNAKLTPSSFDDDNPHTIGHSVLAVGYFAWQASPYVVVLDNDHTTPQYVALPWNTPASASAITPLGAAIPKPATGGSTWGGTVAISADGTCVAIGNNGHATPGMLGVWKWNGASWARLGGDLETMAEDYAGVALSADGSRVIIGDHSHGSSTGRARLFQYNDATDAWDQLREWSGTHSASYGARSVAISEDGELVAIGDTHTTEGNSRTRSHLPTRRRCDLVDSTRRNALLTESKFQSRSLWEPREFQRRRDAPGRFRRIQVHRRLRLRRGNFKVDAHRLLP